MEAKGCSVCKLVKPAEQFHRRASSKDGRKSYCAACAAEYKSVNKDRCNEHCRTYRARHKTRINATRRINEARSGKRNNPPENARAWRQANPEKHKASVNRWRAKNPEARRSHWRNRHARLAAAEGTHSGEQIVALLISQNGRCAFCLACLSGKYHVDHIVPLVRGGSNSIENIQILCPHCNCSKGAKTMDEFIHHMKVA